MGEIELNITTLLTLVTMFFLHLQAFSSIEFSKSKTSRFGYISYSGFNVGDDIQALAAKRFLPLNSIPINREIISQFTSDEIIYSIVNGWFMHTKDIAWRWAESPPEKSWPPSSKLEPFFISIHLSPEFLPVALSQEGIEYLKEHSPIGARDKYTLQKLQEKGIPSYFSGCLTLTLNSSYPEREEIIYAVDIGEDCLHALKQYTHHKIVKLTHWMPLSRLGQENHEERLTCATEILEKYQKAKCVITRRLHAALPCLAFETPVLFISESDPRFEGLQNLTRHCTREEFINGEFDFDFNNPPENLKDYLPVRNNLIKIIEDWISLKHDSNSE